MTAQQLNDILDQFKFSGEVLSCQPYGDGHINDTYKVETTQEKYILQRINTNVFKDVVALMSNVSQVLNHAKAQIEKEGGNPLREALTLIETIDGKNYYQIGEMAYRMYVFIDDTVSLNLSRDEKDFYESGVGFGKFAKLLDGFDASGIKDVIPNFHNTRIRYENFIKTLNADKYNRASGVEKEIEFVKSRESLCGKIVGKLESGEIPYRVTHNDTKLNNVLLDSTTGKAVAVIDLDTVMKGSVCYDFGDSVRFGCSTALEDEEDLNKVHFSLPLFKVYSRGFLGEVKNVLTKAEIDSMALGAIMMTFECGMRFLTDYLDGDNYFRISKPDHNLIRCRTQFKLVEEMEKAYDEMIAIVKQIVSEGK